MSCWAGPSGFWFPCHIVLTASHCVVVCGSLLMPLCLSIAGCAGVSFFNFEPMHPAVPVWIPHPRAFRGCISLFDCLHCCIASIFSKSRRIFIFCFFRLWIVLVSGLLVLNSFLMMSFCWMAALARLSRQVTIFQRVCHR